MIERWFSKKSFKTFCNYTIYVCLSLDGESEAKIMKSVHFAPEDEVAMFEAYEKQTDRQSSQRTGIPRRASSPRKGATNGRNGVRRSSSFESKARPNSGPISRKSVNESQSQVQPGSDDPRSLTDLDLSPYKVSKKEMGLPLKRSNSWTALTSNEPWEPGKGSTPSRPSTRPGEDAADGSKDAARTRTNSEILSARKTFVESKANKLEAKERAEKGNSDDRSPIKGQRPIPILRRTRSASDFDRQQEAKNNGKPKGILVKSGSVECEVEEQPKAPSKKTNAQARSVVKINGVYVTRGTGIKAPPVTQVPPPQKQPLQEVKKASEVKKSVAENEKEGARNFARCLLGILPSVLSLNDTTAVDEALQQFASDVCEAVTCMSLKRKNVPNFGTLRGRSDLVDETSGKGATSDPHFPILNADGVYLTVYKTLALSLNLLKSGHYQKKNSDPPLTQVYRILS